MIRVKDALKALKNRYTISILLLIQFTFGLSTITSSVNIFYNSYYLNSGKGSTLDLKSTYLTTYNDVERYSDDMFTKEQVEEVYSNIKNNKDVIGYGTYYEDYIEIEESTKPIQKAMVKELTSEILHMEKPTIHSIVVDENYYNLLGLNIKKGEVLNNKDFKDYRQDETNVLIGSYFEKYFKVGDVINNQYTIKGFLPKDKFIVNNNSSNEYLKLDKAMIIPMDKDSYNNHASMLNRLHQSTVLKLRDGADIEKLTEYIQLKGSKNILYIKSLGEDINKNVTKSNYTEIPQLILGMCFIVFSIIGIVITTLISIMIRKREFGIKLVLGESNNGIFSQVIIENIIIATVGMILSLVHFSWRYRELLKFSREVNTASTLDIKVNMLILLLVFLLLIIIIVISSSIILLFIKRLQPKELIGGME